MPFGIDLAPKATGLVLVVLGGGAVSRGCVAGCEVNEHADPSTTELVGQLFQRGPESLDRFGVPDADESVAAPALEVRLSEEQKR